MNMSSRKYINAASEYLYMCTLICYTFRSAAFYKDPPLVINALAQELSPQKIKIDVGQVTILMLTKQAIFYMLIQR